MIVAGILTLAVGMAAGFLKVNAAGTLLILTIPLVAVATLSAGLSSRRGGRVSTNLVGFAAMDTTGFSWIFVIFQLAFWAILSLATTVLAVWLLSRSGFPLDLTFAAVLVVLIIIGAAMQWGMATEQRPGLMERMVEIQQGKRES
jgi:hypothetical protein